MFTNLTNSFGALNLKEVDPVPTANANDALTTLNMHNAFTQSNFGLKMAHALLFLYHKFVNADPMILIG